MDIVRKQHGKPKVILSDRVPIFFGKFWTKLFSCLGTQLAHSWSYHPQLDGKLRLRANIWMDIFSSLHMINKHSGWNGSLWQNGFTIIPPIHHKKMSPFMELYGYHPPSMISPLKRKYKSEAIVDHLSTNKKLSRYWRTTWLYQRIRWNNKKINITMKGVLKKGLGIFEDATLQTDVPQGTR